VVVEGLRYDPQNGGSHFAVSSTGALAYTPGMPTSSEHPLSLVDTAGHFSRVGETPRSFREPTFSPDGRRVAVVIGSATESDLWVADVESGTLSRLTFGLRPRRPTWTPDGAAITVGAAARGGWKLITIRRDGSGSPVPLLETPHRAYPNAWSKDGRVLVYQERRPQTGWDLAALDLGPEGQVEGTRSLVRTPFEEENGSLSRDGRFLAYESDELDSVFEIYVRPLRGGGPKVRVSTTGARWPRFGASGRLYCWYSPRGGVQRIAYHAEGDRFVVDGITPAWSRVDEGQAAFSRRVLVMASFGGYDVDPNAERFLVLERNETPLEPPLRRPVIVLNWADELRALGGRP
jgi:Tol biopolymer transport system component